MKKVTQTHKVGTVKQRTLLCAVLSLHKNRGPHNEEGNIDPQGRDCEAKNPLVCCVEPP